MMSGDISKKEAKTDQAKERVPAVAPAVTEPKAPDEDMYALSKARHNADVTKQIAKLRKQGLRHRAKASGYLVKAKKSEERAATLLHKANQMKQESNAILEQAKNKGKSAVDYQKKLDTSNPDAQGSDAEMQMSRLEHEEARLTRQANQMQARAAAMTERATRIKRRSVDFMQKQRSHEIESAQYLKRAEEMDKLRV